jgi:hypothetical protein
MSYININLPPKYNYFGSTSININMMLKLLLCLLFLNGVLSYEVHEGIHIRDTSSAEHLMKVDVSKQNIWVFHSWVKSQAFGRFKKKYVW